MNRTKIKIVKTFLSIFCAAFISCEDNPVSSPPEIPIATLLAAPDTVEINGQKIFLSTYLWRDFMQASPPNGKPLNTLINIESTDSYDLPSSLDAEAIYIVNRKDVWSSYFSDEIPPDNSSFRLVRIAREGPKWGPGISVDVVVLFDTGQEKKLLKASGQFINRTD